MGGIYEERQCDGFSCPGIHITLPKNWFRHSNVDVGKIHKLMDRMDVA
jgi:hypothetical protein